jgi:predicted RNase H-like HicB family nuclease
MTTTQNEQTLPAITFLHEEGVWDEEMTQEGLRQVIFRRPMPMQLISQYAQAAVRHAVTRQLEDGTWFAEVKGFEGAWSTEGSQKEALDVLEDVIFEWVILKIRDEDRDLPVIDSLDLNTL